MKKLILLITSILFFIPCVKAQTIEVSKVYINGYYFIIDNGVERHTDKANMFIANGRTLYCIEPGKKMPETTYTINDRSSFNITEEEKNYIELVSYYGYDYVNHQTDKYYMAAQELIWEKITNYNSYFSTTLNGSDNVNLENEKNEIIRLMNNYNKLPNLLDNYSVTVNKTLSITDNNNVINEYEETTNNLETNINNTLNIIGSIDPKKTKLLFQRKLYDNEKTQILTAQNSQTLAFLRPEQVPKIQIEIEVMGLDIQVSKVDSENNNYKGEATLEGAKYGLYTEDKQLVQEYVTDKEGKITMKNLASKRYFIKELSPSKGYLISDRLTWFNLINNKTLVLTEKIIKSNVIIKNTCDNEPYYNKIKVYDLKDNLIYEGYTNELGILNISLVYGNYYIVQETTNDCEIETKKINIDTTDDITIKINNHNPKAIIQKANIEEKQTTEENIIEYSIPNTNKNKSSINLFLGLIILLGALFVKKVT